MSLSKFQRDFLIEDTGGNIFVWMDWNNDFQANGEI